MSLQITNAEIATALAVQVKRQIAAVQQQKANVPTAKANLTALLAKPEVVAALGADLADAQAAVAAM